MKKIFNSVINDSHSHWFNIIVFSVFYMILFVFFATILIAFLIYGNFDNNTQFLNTMSKPFSAYDIPSLILSLDQFLTLGIISELIRARKTISQERPKFLLILLVLILTQIVLFTLGYS